LGRCAYRLSALFVTIHNPILCPNPKTRISSGQFALDIQGPLPYCPLAKKQCLITSLNSKYEFKYEWYKPNGKMEGTKIVIQHVKDSNWYTGNWLKLDLKYVHPSDLWSTKIFANDIFLGSGKFLFADNTSELSRLEKEYSARLIEPAVKATTDQQTQQAKPSFDKGIIGKSWAVIIGLSSYKYSGNNGLPNLIFADDDAKAFANTLKKLGWSESHINFLINEKATRKNILIALESRLTLQLHRNMSK